MKLFGWKSAGRGSSRPMLSRAFTATWFAGEWPRSYEAQVRELYLENAVAQRAVRLVAEGVASAPLQGADEALALVSATSGGQSLLETIAMQLLLHGNAYVETLRGPDGRPTELYALRPERVAIEADVRGWPAAFRYRVGETVSLIPAERMIHIRTHHPLDDHYGLGCLGAAAGALAAHNAATRWNKVLLDNAARPSGALVHEAGEVLSHDQFERLQAELRENFSGKENSGKPMLLEGGLRWQPLSMTPADMDFANLKAAAAREIALAFGVPPVLPGLPGDATYSNYREANRVLWRQAILPLGRKLLSALSEGLRPWFDGLELAVDLDQVVALAEDRERLWAQMAGADFLTGNEKREMLGLLPVTDNDAAAVEHKFNPYHDRDDGQFTFAPGGGSFGGGGAGASGKWDVPSSPKPKPQPPKTAPAPQKRKAIPVRTRPSQAPIERPGTKRVSRNGYDFDLGHAKRTEKAGGELRMVPDQVRSKPAQRRAGGTERLSSDHGGHYIAREFGGPEKDFNHFAQDANFNKSEYRALEIHRAKELRAGRKVKVDIVPKYIGDAVRPYRLDVTYYVDGRRSFKKFKNVGKGK